MDEIKGYKVFNPDWTCRGFQYDVGETFEEDVDPSCCNRGFHFCREVKDCFNYYQFNSDNKVAEVTALGQISRDGDKCCTNKIHVVREITGEEVLIMVNLGKSCTGLCNTGDCNTGNRNTGNRNTGNWNTGDCNTGDCNTGDCNTGNRNTGNRNTGNWNTGDCNTGDWNTGNRNTGDWNSTNFSNGCFNTEEPKIMLFNALSDWTYYDWLISEARSLLNNIPKNIVEWVRSENMTDEEKESHPTHECTRGYLKVLDESECSQMWWDGLSKGDREIIEALPNFDVAIFEQITEIKLEGKDE